MDDRWLVVRRWYHQHEGRLIRVWLGLTALVLLAAALPATRSRALNLSQRAADEWDERWSRRLAEGEALVDAGAWTRAAGYLTALDREFPAQHVKHGRDRERERLLLALGRSWTELDRKALALDTYRRLAAFDELNFSNHYALGLALIHFNEEAEAEPALRRALELNPVHLPSLRALVLLRFDAGAWAEVASLFETYLRAYHLRDVGLLLNDTATVVQIPIDGRWHHARALAVRPAGWQGELGFDTGGLYAELAEVVLTGPQLAGRPGQHRVVLAPPGQAPWTVDGTAAFDGTARPAAFRLPLPLMTDGVEGMDVLLRLKKPVDPDLWRLVELSYRNRLDWEGLEAVRAVTHVHPSALSADSVRVDG